MGVELFFELIQVSIGNRERLSRQPSESEWMQLYALAEKQSLTGVLLEGVEKIKSTDGTTDIPQTLLLNWIGERLQVEAQNKLQNERTKELCGLLSEAGFRSCVLKGQGTSLYYPHPEYRQCGDIDIWVASEGIWNADKSRDEILRYTKEQGYHIGHIDIKHSDIDFFKDVPVEVHFLPSWMYRPATNKKLQDFFAEQAESQFSNSDSACGFIHTTVEFDLVYSMVHIFRHIFSEGIGMRQLMDYYYILTSSTIEQRNEAYGVLRGLKMAKFVGGIMWILCGCFGLKEEFVLCPVNEMHGKYLLSEIMIAGNFGHFDDRMQHIDKNKRFKRGFVQLKRNLKFVGYYPSEVLWSPFWKLWHFAWRKRKGYL